MNRDRGTALVIVVLVTAILTLLGVAFLFMADTENRIAENERLSSRSLYFAEGVAREVKRWFDRPPYTTSGGANLSRPTTDVVDRTLRSIDPDGAGPAAGVAADGSAARPYYKGGIDRDRDGHDDIFDRPYRGDPADAFLGTPMGPDIRIDRAASAAATAFLDALAETIAPESAGGAADDRPRIKTIDVYAPPYLSAGGGVWRRFGVATVRVRVQILRHPGTESESVLADRSVGMVLNEAPFAAAFGPLHACDELVWANSFKVHWGVATATMGAALPSGPESGMPRGIPRDVPPGPGVDLLHGHDSPSGDATWSLLLANLEGRTIGDPWFRFFAGREVVNWSGLPSPQAYPPGTAEPDRSNRYQNVSNVPCPTFDYRTWKSIARSGASDVHYFAWDTGSRFREDGFGPSTEFETLTDGRTGLFFFDTEDGRAPHDFDAGRVAANLTPQITIQGSGYGTRGFLYVNTAMWRVVGSPGRPATFTLPGEPFRDRNGNGRKDADEEWINLRYNEVAAIGDPLVVDASDTYDGSVPPPATPRATWNERGPSLIHDALVWGILYVTGQFDASGTPFYDGSVVTYAGTETGARTEGSADLFWDPAIVGQWPPAGWDLPRVVVTRWEIDD